jgi:hypothetical protein
MPLGPDRCNGPSGYMGVTIPPPDSQAGRRFDFESNIMLYVYDYDFCYTV